MIRTILLVVLVTLLAGRGDAQAPAAATAHPAAHVTAHVVAGTQPAWSKGIVPINQESYWNAVACGKQGGARPACVFYDADLCKNSDFTIALFTPYKMVAYQVWQAVSRKQPAPTPSYADAQRTRITVGVTPVAGSKNPITAVEIKRDGKTVLPATRSIDETGGRFIFDVATFAPTADLTIELVGRSTSVSCLVERPALALLR